MKRTLLSVKELAVELGISEDSVRRAYRSGSIPGERICRMIRFDLALVRQAMRGNGPPSPAAAPRAGAGRIGDSRPPGVPAPPHTRTAGAHRGTPSRRRA